MKDIQVIQSVVMRRYLVSTIRRDTSASMQPPVSRFYETLVWEWNKEKGERIDGNLIYDFHGDDDSENSLNGHYAICGRIASKYREEQDK